MSASVRREVVRSSLVSVYVQTMESVDEQTPPWSQKATLEVAIAALAIDARRPLTLLPE